MTDAAMATPTRRADMWYAGTAPQRRLTVAFRIILAIPQFIVLYFLGLATFFVAVIAWFAALFMGRLPEWAHSFLSGMVRWFTRVAAYMYLLTDRYPPFSLDDEEYPARPILPAPGRLNRWAVLFRLILAIPAAVFSQIVQYGLTFPLLLVMWFVVLISGRMPASLYPTYSALLRYQVRFHSYFLMLTSVYAWGMLGDPAAAAGSRVRRPAVRTPRRPPPYAAPPQRRRRRTLPSTGAPTGLPGYRTPPAQPYSYPSVGAETTRTPSDEVTPEDRTEPETTPMPEMPVQRRTGTGTGPTGPTPAPAATAVAPAGAAPPPAPPPAGIGGMPPPSPWERVAPSLPAEEQTPAWATLVLAGAATGLDDLRHRVGLHRLPGSEHHPERLHEPQALDSTQFNTVRPDPPQALQHPQPPRPATVWGRAPTAVRRSCASSRRTSPSPPHWTRPRWTNHVARRPGPRLTTGRRRGRPLRRVPRQRTRPPPHPRRVRRARIVRPHVRASGAPTATTAAVAPSRLVPGPVEVGNAPLVGRDGVDHAHRQPRSGAPAGARGPAGGHGRRHGGARRMVASLRRLPDRSRHRRHRRLRRLPSHQVRRTSRSADRCPRVSIP